MNQKELSGRGYVRVSDEQRSIIIDLMSQNEHLSIRECSDLLSINYESVKQIWTVFKKEGRKHKLKPTKPLSMARNHNQRNRLDATLNERAILKQFDHACKMLRTSEIEFKEAKTDPHLMFSARLLKIKKIKRKQQRM